LAVFFFAVLVLIGVGFFAVLLVVAFFALTLLREDSFSLGRMVDQIDSCIAAERQRHAMLEFHCYEASRVTVH
jgi:hypothetical protein